MTRIWAETGDTLRLRGEGHAEGSREVCGAISVLLQTLAAWAADNGELVTAQFAPGVGEVIVGRGARREFELVCLGLELLARDYGTYVELCPGE